MELPAMHELRDKTKLWGFREIEALRGTFPIRGGHESHPASNLWGFLLALPLSEYRLDLKCRPLARAAGKSKSHHGPGF